MKCFCTLPPIRIPLGIKKCARNSASNMSPIANIYPDKNLVNWDVCLLKITTTGDRSFCYTVSPPTPAISVPNRATKKTYCLRQTTTGAHFMCRSRFTAPLFSSALFVATLHIRGRSRVKTRSKKVKEVAAGLTPHKISIKIVEIIIS